MLTSQEIIARYYVGYYNRAPDPGGFAFWVNALEDGISTLEIASFFSDQVETRALYPYFANPGSTTPAEFITSIYQNLFNRDPDSDGLNFWVSVLTNGSVSTGQFIEEIIGGATTNPDLAVVQNKVAAGLYWEDQANNFTDFAYTQEVAQSASTVLNVITDDVATVTLSRAQANTLFATLSEEKTAPENGVTNDGTQDDKIGLFADGPLSEAQDTGGIGVLSVESADVLNLNSFRADARFAGINGQGVTVVVIDTGIDIDHAAFGPDTDGNGVADRIIYARDFTNEGDGTPNDIQSHGTHVASIIGSSAAGFTGVAPGVNIVALQALDNSGNGTGQGIEAALQWVVANAETLNIVAVNMSLGAAVNVNSQGIHPTYGDELRVLHDQLGVVTIAAAGNSYERFQAEGTSFLSADPNTISIGSVGGSVATGGDISSFSQRSNDIPTIFAPGGAITAAVPGGGTGEKSGTSMAAPQVAGAVALAQQLAQQELGRFLTPSEITGLLTSTADIFNDDENTQDRVLNTGLDFARVDMFDLGEAIIALRDAQPDPGGSPSGDNIADSIATNASIAVGATVQSAIDVSGDLDYFSMSLTPGTYAFTLNGAATSDGTLSDPLLTLFSASGSYLTTNDDGGTGLNSLIEYTVSSEATFYLSAGAYGSASGTYEIGVAQTGNAAGEIGDTIATTGSLSIGQPLSNEIESSADRDWFAIDLVAGQRYQFDLVGDTLPDPSLFLYGSTGALLAGDDDGGTGLNARLEYIAGTTGTHFVSAEAYTNTMTGTYTLTATEMAAQSDDFGNDLNTNGVVAADNGSTVGVLEQSGDRDVFRINLLGNTTYEFSLTGNGGADGLSDPVLSLFDASGQFIGSDDDSGEGLNALISYSTFTDHTVFLLADSFNSASTGSYTIGSVVAFQTQQDIAGDTSTTAVLEAGQTRAGVLEQAGDKDWYAVNVKAGNTYDFSLMRSGDAPMADPYLILLDSVGNLIGFDDDSGGDRNASISFQAGADGRVYISAEAFDLLTDMGTYEIALAVTAPSAPDVPGDLTTTATVAAGQTIAGILEMPGDTDLFGLDVEAGQRYVVDMTSAGDDPMSDPYLGLFDSLGNLLLFDDDAGPVANDAQIVFDAFITGRVYVSAEAQSVTVDDGTYALSVASSPSPAPPAVVGQSASLDFDVI